jgi:hypothetical protein
MQISPNAEGAGKPLELEQGGTMEAEAMTVKDASTAAVRRGQLKRYLQSTTSRGLGGKVQLLARLQRIPCQRPALLVAALLVAEPRMLFFGPLGKLCLIWARNG